MPRLGRSPTISVVVCAYTLARWELIVRSVQSVREQTVPALEVVLVVDHSPELLARAPQLGDDVRVVASTRAAGLSGARNTGVATARGDVVAFLDDDAAAAPDWLEHLARPYLHPSVLGVGGHVVAEWERERPVWFPPEFDWVVGCSYVGLPTAVAVVRNPIGANMSFRRSALTAAGGFSGEVGRVGTRPVGCEETEVSIRMTRVDPRALIILEPGAVVRHHVPGDRARWSYFWRRCWAEGLSKAAVRRLTDARSALASERTYVSRTLPRGAGLALVEAVRHRRVGAAARAAGIGAGLAVTTAGYAFGRARRTTPCSTPIEEDSHGDDRGSELARLRHPRAGGRARTPGGPHRTSVEDHAGGLRRRPLGT